MFINGRPARKSKEGGAAVVTPLSDSFGLPRGLLAALCGTEQELRAAFGQGGAADTMRPGPVLAAVTEQAAAELPDLSDDELTGVIHAARRLESRAFSLQAAAVAQFTRRRAGQLEDAKARNAPRGCREGEYPDLELAAELLISRRRALVLMDEATELATRLPRTFAAMAGGRIDPARALAIAGATACLSGPDAARADEVLSADAHELRADTLARRAAALAMKLDPEAAAREREDARNTRQRVEARREDSGNASLSGREMDTAEVMAAKASIDAIAVRLRNAGVEGSLDALRSRAFLDLLQFRDPFDRVSSASAFPPASTPSSASSPASTPASSAASAAPDEDGGRHPAPRADEAGRAGEADAGEEPDEGGTRYPAGPGTPARGQAPLPALINLIVPAASLLGWGTAPGQAGSWGLTDPAETRDIITAASQHPRTRWCATVVSQGGEAAAHACARGRHPWTAPPASPGTDPPPGPGPPPAPPHPGPGSRPGPGTPPGMSQAMRSLLRDLGLTPESFAPIAKGACGHRHAEARYTPSRTLKHLIRARAQSCTAPGCAAQSFHADHDHVIPYPDGPTDECNLHAPCRAHHRAKQAPGWHAEQPQPGIIRWTLPNGRTHLTRPTAYDC